MAGEVLEGLIQPRQANLGGLGGDRAQPAGAFAAKGVNPCGIKGKKGGFNGATTADGFVLLKKEVPKHAAFDPGEQAPHFERRRHQEVDGEISKGSAAH